MKITKKDQIINLYKNGFEIENIIEKGFNKKYVKQVLKELKVSGSPDSCDKEININDIKDLSSLLESMQSNCDSLNVNINISINVDRYNSNSTSIDMSLLNPVNAFKYMGDDKLKEQLKLFGLEDLMKIIKAYIPDSSGRIYKQKDVNVVIAYILEKASKLSKIEQIFKTENNEK